MYIRPSKLRKLLRNSANASASDARCARLEARVVDLLEANNKYLTRARTAEAVAVEAMSNMLGNKAAGHA